MSPWGKAGERITTEQARERARARQAPARRASAVAKESNAARLSAAHKAWKAGLARPDMITKGLNFRNLYGPEVDRACGVEEPTVDLWEAGRVYPTWEQLAALAALCELPVWWFTEEPLISAGDLFICGRGRVIETTPPITTFDPMALAAAGINPYPNTPGTDDNGQTRLL